MKIIISNKIHLQNKEGKKSLCGQSPWTNPVRVKDGKFEDITCLRCKSKIEKGEF